MKFTDLPKAERRTLVIHAYKRNPRLKWYHVFITVFSGFTAYLIAANHYPTADDFTGRCLLLFTLFFGFLYWGHLSIIQPRLMREITRITKES